MQKKLSISILGLALLGASVNVQASLVEVMPLSYSFDQATDSGTYNYSDWGGNQLTDGQYGTAPWYANLGNGNAYEWVGWANDPTVNIDFDLGSTATINQINVGTVQDHVNDVVIPDINLYSSTDGFSWTFIDSIITPESSANNNSYFSMEFTSLNLTDQFYRVQLVHNTNGPWTFVDEVDFYHEASTNVPEPSIIALLGLGLTGLGLIRRRREK